MLCVVFAAHGRLLTGWGSKMGRLALAALLAACPTLADAKGKSHGPPKVEKQQLNKSPRDKPSRDKPSRGRVDSTPCQVGQCGWTSPGRVEHLGDCKSNPQTCSGTDPRLLQLELQAIDKPWLRYRNELCRGLPMLSQAGCLGIPELTQANGQAAYDAMGFKGTPNVAPVAAPVLAPVVVDNSGAASLAMLGGAFRARVVVSGRLVLAGIVDTGANVVTICGAALTQAGIMASGKAVMMRDATGGTTQGTQVTLASVSIGGVTVHNVLAVATPGACRVPVLVGMSWLDKLESVTIKGRTMELRQ